MAAARGTAPGKALVVYTAMRFGLFLLCLLVFYGAGMGLFLALVVAAVVSGVAGYFLLARQRIALSIAVDDKVQQSRAKSEERAAREDPIAEELAARENQHPSE